MLLTQPMLLGNTVDDVRLVNLARIKGDDVNAALGSELPGLYSDVTRMVGRKRRLFVLAVTRSTPKSSRL